MTVLTQFWYPSFRHLRISRPPPPCLKCQPREGDCALVWMVWMPMSFLSKDSSGLSQKQVNAPRWHFEGYLQISCNHLCWKPWPILIFRVPGLSFKGSSVAWGWISKGATRAALFSRPIVFFVKSCCLLFGLHTGTYEMLEKFAHFKIRLVVSFSKVEFSELIWHTPASITCSLCL